MHDATVAGKNSQWEETVGRNLEQGKKDTIKE